jgi:2-polyprenyl-3-methyl-5-hydroxy-6-metoxy-1,4-benzoquinol methylase
VIEDETLERIVPDRVDFEDLAGRESLKLHEERYRFAAEHAQAGSLLDLACGVGYGTRLMADQRADIASLLGVDMSSGAIEYADRTYATELPDRSDASDASGASGRLRYEQADAMTFGESDSRVYDTVVSLETIEHLPRPQAFFDRLCGLLAPGGVLIASVPTTPSVDLNPHHLHDFTRRSFREMGARAGLTEVASHQQIQKVGISELWSRDRRFRAEQLRSNLPGYYATHPDALIRRVATTLRHGLANHYWTIVWKKQG